VEYILGNLVGSWQPSRVPIGWGFILVKTHPVGWVPMGGVEYQKPHPWVPVAQPKQQVYTAVLKAWVVT
jgi:hypothetical protein